MRRKELWQNVMDGIGYKETESAKQYKYLYRRMLDGETIRKAWKNLRKGKTKRKEVIKIEADFEAEVQKMKETIKNTKPPGTPVEHPEMAFRPRRHKAKIIHEHGKQRRIYMPEIHEQWLHHIIVLILAPIILRTAYRYSCGSFPGRGAHYGKRAIERWIRSGKGIRNFAKIDIRHFYDNIRLSILMRELAIRIKDEWFLYIIRLCLKEFPKGIPLGFYISQWLANYLLEPLDRLLVKLGFHKMNRYMDDIVFFDNAKKNLHKGIAAVKRFLGRRFRLKLKRNEQVCRFRYEGKHKTIGRALDYMGFLFYREKTIMRKGILIRASRLAKRMHRAKAAGGKYYLSHIKAMLSYMGWFSATDTYDSYLKHIKPYVEVRKLKAIISKTDRRKNQHERLEQRTLQLAA